MLFGFLLTPSQILYENNIVYSIKFIIYIIINLFLIKFYVPFENIGLNIHYILIFQIPIVDIKQLFMIYLKNAI